MSHPPERRCPSCFTAQASPGEAPCPHCGWRPGLDNEAPFLPLGTRLDGRYRIGRVLGHGGFGITYLAWDGNLELPLAIKEYLPRDLATRGANGATVSVYSARAEDFDYGLARFLEEARALARFDRHPGIVGVKNFLRANATGYIVMEYLPGLTLKDYLERKGGRIPYPTALALLMPVMDALRAVHEAGLLHRDIAPDNIRITPGGQVALLDFGAARQATGEQSRSLSVILKPGYAPEEQYRTRGKQGPWTDVYALAATLYRCITGQTPPEALDRAEEDELLAPSRLGIEIPRPAEQALLAALAVKPRERTQDIESFLAYLEDAAEPSIRNERHQNSALRHQRRELSSDRAKAPYRETGARNQILESRKHLSAPESKQPHGQPSRPAQLGYYASGFILGGLIANIYLAALLFSLLDLLGMPTDRFFSQPGPIWVVSYLAIAHACGQLLTTKFRPFVFGSLYVGFLVNCVLLIVFVGAFALLEPVISFPDQAILRVPWIVWVLLYLTVSLISGRLYAQVTASER